MEMIEIDQDVSRILTEMAKQQGITRNGVLRKLLGLDKHNITSVKEITIKKTTRTPKHITQDELIPYIIEILYEHSGKASKALVEKEIFKLFQHEFEKTYYQKIVSHGIPRWKKNIAWAKERARQKHGFIKDARESGYGIWELTDAGVAYYENNLRK